MAGHSLKSKRKMLYITDRLTDLFEQLWTTDADALEKATEVDAEREEGKTRGPLHGIPLMAKDNMASKDKMEITSGSWATMGRFVVSKLRESGAISLRQPNLSEWTSMRSYWYSDGFSARVDQIRSPYDLSKSPFGSCGGSIVAVAANLVPLTCGTETDGSIIGPAQINAIVGIKPTPGLTSRNGIIPASLSFDTVGLMARTLADAVIGMEAIMGEDGRDPLTKLSSVRRESNYSQYLNGKAGLKGARFALPKELVEKIFEGMKQAGAEILEMDYPCAEDRIAPNGKWDWDVGTASRREFTVLQTEIYNRKFEDILEYNIENTGSEGANAGDHPAFPTGHDIFQKIADHRGVEDQEYKDALAYIRRMTRDEGIDAVLANGPERGNKSFDAIILSDRRLVGQQIAAQAGYPTITVSIGVDKDSMPVGVTLQQSAWKEGILIKLAHGIECVRDEVLGGRPLPRYVDHLAKNIPIGRKHVKL
ncbi:amidase signature enzyme [Tothia fuscella]|uniref:Amidase signature enzyme n=1 Tax=Tothia fuscella TaxID=1048955 RepID=A0A9P4TXD3_9PEZI|nr:amidase signature enzyme [Tothia fuscella]